MIVWILVALILGSIVYSIKTMGEYRVIVLDLQPRVEALIAKADRFEEQAHEETDRSTQAKERVRELKEFCATVQRETRLIEAEIRKAQQAEEQLGLQAQKLDFEKRR